jgi:hypothetical protein
MRKWALQAGTGLAGVSLFLLALMLAGRTARQDLRDRDRFVVVFLDIDCPAPADMARSDFLSEVQYLTGMTSRLRLLDDDLPSRLREAFTRHPWVETVERVAILPGRVSIDLVFRTPVLRIAQGGQVRVVDRHGILLPSTVTADGLPLLHTVAKVPGGPAGTPWGDPAVEEAARAAWLAQR